MKKIHRSLPLLVALIALISMPATAEVFTISLANGAELETRYQPQQDPRSEDRILMLTTVGNWIALPKSMVTGIASETESKGFGTHLDTNTIIIGWAPNDAPVEGPDTDMDPAARLLNYMQARDSARQQDFSVKQFVNVEDAGVGGLPAAGAAITGNSSFPVYGGGGRAPNEPSVINQ